MLANCAMFLYCIFAAGDIYECTVKNYNKFG